MLAVSSSPPARTDRQTAMLAGRGAGGRVAEVDVVPQLCTGFFCANAGAERQGDVSADPSTPALTRSSAPT